MGIHQALRILSAVVVASMLTGCPTGPDIKVWKSSPKAGGLVRRQANEIMPYAKTGSCYCTCGEDTRTLLDYCGIQASENQH